MGLRVHVILLTGLCSQTIAAEGGPKVAPRHVSQLGDGCSAVRAFPNMMLYAAHCGTDFTGSWSHHDWVSFDRCLSHQEAGLGSGTDIAACRVPPDATGAPVPVSIAKSEDLESGRAALILGTGSRLGPISDIPHIIEGVIVGTEPEIVVEFDHGETTCRGDSGGAVFVLARGEWKLAGIVSSKHRSIGDCNWVMAEGKSTVNAVRIDSALAWLESLPVSAL